MGNNRKTSPNKNTIDSTLRSISSGKRRMPKSGFILLILLYMLATVIVIKTSHETGADYTLMGKSIPLVRFTGVFSSLANMCTIFLVIFYGKLGFVVSLCLMGAQYAHMIFDFFYHKNYSSLAGMFTSMVTFVAIIVIYIIRNRAEQYQRSLVESAITDKLTGLPNRFAGREYLSRIMKRGEKVVYVAADINNFKSINDTMGYEVGNRILIEVADRWRQLADGGTTGTFDLVAHISGDEFGISIQGYQSDEDVVNTINMFKEELERKITIDDYDYYVKASYGYAEFPTDAEDLESLISFANLTLHDVKRRGNTDLVLRYSPDLLQSEKTLQIEHIIREALDSDTIFCHLQPQYDINHKLRGFEALARLKNADGTYISPVDFIPVAEKTGLIDQVDMRIFHKAAKFLESAIQSGKNDISISVNISVKHLLKNNFMDDIREILNTYKIGPENLEIEITESVMIESVKRAQEIIEEVKRLGIKVAIDDFGTGYSSLSYLHNFPANLLKIDKSFIDAMSTGESSQKYVESIISIGHVLGLEVISEGVETEGQLEILKGIHCDLIQGYIWGRPMPPEEAMKLVND